MTPPVPAVRGVFAAGRHALVGLAATLLAGVPWITADGQPLPTAPAVIASAGATATTAAAAPATASATTHAPAAAPAPATATAPAVSAPATASATAPASAAAPAVPAPADASAPSPDMAAPGAATEDIRDIRGPKYLWPAWLILALAAGALLLVLGAYAAWRWLRLRRRPRMLLPFELALQQLEEIRPLMQPASAREFSIAVSDIVRRYIEQRFDVVATHRTTEEFLHDLLKFSKPALARHRGLLAEFLEQCDLVKFGGMSLTTPSMGSLHHSAREFVLETAKPEPVTGKPPQAPRIKEAHDSLPST